MIDKIKELFVKHREIIVYIIVGGLTTIVSWAGCFICKWLFLNPDIPWQNDIINTIGWVVGVVFAYPLNRKWVFESTNANVAKEFLNFAASRLSTWILDLVIMKVTVNVLNMNWWVSKILISAVLVTILNYVFSKLFIFKKKKPVTEDVADKIE